MAFTHARYKHGFLEKIWVCFLQIQVYSVPFYLLLVFVLRYEWLQTNSLVYLKQTPRGNAIECGFMV